MTQVLATADFGVEYRNYASGSVIDFSDSSVIAHLVSRKVVDARPAAVTAAIAAGALQFTHTAGRPAAIPHRAGTRQVDQLIAGVVGCSQEDSYQSNDFQYNMHWINEWNAANGHPIRVVLELGVSGSQIEEYSPYVDQVLAYPGMQVLFLGPPTNNIVRGVPSATESGMYSAAKAKEYILRARGRGVIVIPILVDGGITPNDPTYTWTTDMERQAAIYADEIRKLCAGTDDIPFDGQAATKDFTILAPTNIVGTKKDSLHNAPGGAWRIADFIDDTGLFRTLIARVKGLWQAILPSRDKWSGLPANPVNLLDNVGFMNPTGGNSNELAQAVIAPFAANTTISAADPFYDSGTHLYYVPGGKVGGFAAAHTHTGFMELKDGAISLFPNTDQVPQGWGFKRSGAGPTARCRVVFNPDAKPKPRNELVVLMKFTARSQTLALSAGEFAGASAADFLSRFVDGAWYELLVNINLYAHSGVDGPTPSGLNQMPLIVARGGSSVAAENLWPTDGSINDISYDRDVNNKTTMQLGRFPKKWLRWVRPYRHTSRSTYVTAYAPQVRAAGAGWVLFTVGGDYIWRKVNPPG